MGNPGTGFENMNPFPQVGAGQEREGTPCLGGIFCFPTGCWWPHWEPGAWCQVLTSSHCLWSTDLGILLGMTLGNEGPEVWPLAHSKDCMVTGFLRDKLQYRNRLQYMVTTRALALPPSPGLSSWGGGGGLWASLTAFLQHTHPGCQLLPVSGAYVPSS